MKSHIACVWFAQAWFYNIFIFIHHLYITNPFLFPCLTLKTFQIFYPSYPTKKNPFFSPCLTLKAFQIFYPTHPVAFQNFYPSSPATEPRTHKLKASEPTQSRRSQRTNQHTAIEASGQTHRQPPQRTSPNK